MFYLNLNKGRLKEVNILNIAWVGQGDFGDDLMAYILRRFLKNHGIKSITYYQHGDFPIYSNEDDLKISFLYNFKTSRWKRSILDKIFLRKFNVLIIGGGSTLHSIQSIKWKLEIAERIRKDKGLAVCCGVGLGPFKSALNEKICGQLLDNLDLAIVRDKYSFALAKKVSNNEKIYFSFDTTLLLPELCPNKMPDIQKRESDLVGLIFVKNALQKEFFNTNCHLEKYLSILNYILDKGKKVMLLTLYTGSDYLDRELNQTLKKLAKYPERIEIHDYESDIFETMYQLNRCSYIVSMRLHGIITSYMLGIPFLSLGYDPKNKNFCDSINYPANMSFNFNSLEDIAPVLKSLDILFEENTKLFNQSLPLEEATKKVKDNLNLLIELIDKK